MKKTIFFLALFFTALISQAQTPFRSTVKIEFEKIVALKQLIKDLDDGWFEMIKDQLPATAVNYYDFIGDTTKSIYKPGREVAANNHTFFLSEMAASKNVVYNDYKNGTTTSQKPVFEETFLIQDSLANIKWKLTPDTRTIAGYDCRKAIGLLNDSITVFAFYTDEILVSGGPESIHGLPGMILGVGIPRLHTTWFATKVEVFDVNMNVVTPASKGKKVTKAVMLESLSKVLKEWGQYGTKLMVNFMI